MWLGNVSLRDNTQYRKAFDSRALSGFRCETKMVKYFSERADYKKRMVLIHVGATHRPLHGSLKLRC